MGTIFRRYYLFAGVAVALLALLAVACGDDDDDDGGDDGGGATVNVLLSEFVVGGPRQRLRDVTFAVTNEARKRTSSSSKRPGRRRPADCGRTEIEDIEAGADGEVTANLEAGAYVLLCNIVEEDDGESHYAEGMHTAFTVE
jgi:hypothetical protein